MTALNTCYKSRQYDNAFGTAICDEKGREREKKRSEIGGERRRTSVVCFTAKMSYKCRIVKSGRRKDSGEGRTYGKSGAWVVQQSSEHGGVNPAKSILPSRACGVRGRELVFVFAALRTSARSLRWCINHGAGRFSGCPFCTCG